MSSDMSRFVYDLSIRQIIQSASFDGGSPVEYGKNSIPDLALLKSNDWAFWGPGHTGDGATGTQQAGGALDKTIPKKKRYHDIRQGGNP